VMGITAEGYVAEGIPPVLEISATP
jgi:hypothetical protein